MRVGALESKITLAPIHLETEFCCDAGGEGWCRCYGGGSEGEERRVLEKGVLGLANQGDWGKIRGVSGGEN